MPNSIMLEFFSSGFFSNAQRLSRAGCRSPSLAKPTAKASPPPRASQSCAKARLAPLYIAGRPKMGATEIGCTPKDIIATLRKKLVTERKRRQRFEEKYKNHRSGPTEPF